MGLRWPGDDQLGQLRPGSGPVGAVRPRRKRPHHAGSDYDRKQILLALKEGQLDATVVLRSACRVLRLMLGINVNILIGE